MTGIARMAGAALMALAVLLVLPGSVAAQGRPPGGGGPPASLTVTPAEVVFPTPTSLDFTTGWVDGGAVDVTIQPRGNRPNWQIFVQATAADMGGYGKAVQDVEVRFQGSATWIPLATTAQLIAEGSGDATVTLYYRLRLDWTLDDPGAYSVPLEYTAASVQ